MSARERVEAAAGPSGAPAPRESRAADAPLLPVYARADVVVESGEGAWLVTDDGRRLLDFLAGVAVVNLGHCHPAVLAAARTQMDRVWHASNLVWTKPMAALAERLSRRFGGAEAFFCNSGAESIEAALKYARKATERGRLIALEGSFHGRTLGALSVTGQPGKRRSFEPLVPDVAFARLNDVESLRSACRVEPPACLLIEPVQGEGGVHPATSAFLEEARALADRTGALLVFDEIQTGVGRTGTFFAWEQARVRPDAVTLAKGLANGLPIGCLLVAEGAAGAFVPGDHASTFGGNPIACAAACAVCDELDEGLLARVRLVGERVRERLSGLPGVLEARGAGLLIGAELERPAAGVVEACLERGLLVSSAGERVLRLTPPLVVADEEVELALAMLADALAA